MGEQKRNVYQRLAAVIKESGAIAKTGKAALAVGGYAFHKVDEVVDHLRPLLVKNGVLPLVSVVEDSSRDLEVTRKGGVAAIDHVATCTIEVVWVNVDDPDDRTPPMRAFGDGIDSSDKAPGKATSYAWKNHLLVMFHLRGQPDNETGETERRPPERPRQGAAPAPEPPSPKPKKKPKSEKEPPIGSVRAAKKLSCQVAQVLGSGDRPRAWRGVQNRLQELDESGNVGNVVSEAQAGRLKGIANDSGFTMEQLHDELETETGLTSTRNIPWNVYAAICVLFGGEPEDPNR